MEPDEASDFDEEPGSKIGLLSLIFRFRCGTDPREIRCHTTTYAFDNGYESGLSLHTTGIGIRSF